MPELWDGGGDGDDEVGVGWPRVSSAFKEAAGELRGEGLVDDARVVESGGDFVELRQCRQ